MPPSRDAITRQVGRRIAEIRRARDLTQQDVATNLDVATKYYQRIERGLQNLTLASLDRIAEALDVPLQALLEPPRDQTAPTGRPRRVHRRVLLGASAAFRIVDRRAAAAIPLYSLTVAAGAVGHGELAEVAAWVVPMTRRRVRRGMFVARVSGTSMEPSIPDGAFCLFDARARLEPDGQVYLVEHRDHVDPDTGNACSVKRVSLVGGSVALAKCGRRLRLAGDAPDCPARTADVGPESDPQIRLVARLIDVLGV